MFKALVLNKDTDNNVQASVQSVSEEQLPEGNVLVAVEFSTVNYKDGLCMKSNSTLVNKYPHVPGIDMAGTVEESSDARYKAGDKVVLTGWRYGENHWGGYAQKTRVNADWLVGLPNNMTTRQAMAVGTAGLTAMLCVMALEQHGLKPDDGPVLVTGAAGGVGSIAVSILSGLGYEIAAVTGRPETSDYLRQLGATTIVARDTLNTLSKRPLESETWAGCIDTVGGDMLSRIFGQMKYGSSVAAVGLAGGVSINTTVIPFIVRGVSLLGVDSVMRSYESRVTAWQRISKELPIDKLESMAVPATLEDLPQLGKDILNGKVRGRVVVNINS